MDRLAEHFGLCYYEYTLPYIVVMLDVSVEQRADSIDASNNGIEG